MAFAPYEPEQSGAIVTFLPAVRKRGPALISLYGFSGSGKTLSALLIARGLAGPEGKIAFLDTEGPTRERALDHAGRADVGEFLHGGLTPPFTPERYAQALRDLYALKPDVGVVDSLSHEWEGDGGLSEIAGEGKGLLRWQAPKARHKKFKRVLIDQAPMHLIVCFRAKRKLVQREGANGKTEIIDAGVVPIQEEGFIYETTAQLYLPVPSHDDGGKERGVPRIDRCPADLLAAFPQGKQIGVATGAHIRDWIAGAAPVDRDHAALVRDAREAAEQGVEAYRRWFEALTPERRRSIADEHANLKSIAAAADQQKARREEGGGEASRVNFAPAGSPPLDDPPPKASATPATASAATPQPQPPESGPGSDPPADPGAASGSDWDQWADDLRDRIYRAARGGGVQEIVQLMRDEEAAIKDAPAAVAARVRRYADDASGALKRASAKA